jgi:elongation factor Tu
LLARQVGVPAIVVFLNKCDMVDDKELEVLFLIIVSLNLFLYIFNDVSDMSIVVREISSAHTVISSII